MLQVNDFMVWLQEYLEHGGDNEFEAPVVIEKSSNMLTISDANRGFILAEATVHDNGRVELASIELSKNIQFTVDSGEGLEDEAYRISFEIIETINEMMGSIQRNYYV